MKKQMYGLKGGIGAGELADYDIPRIDIPLGHMKEDGKRVRDEVFVPRISQNKPRTKNNMVIKRGPEQASVKVA